MSEDKHWIFSQVSSLFGGLGICSLEAVVAKDDKEYIIEINDSATSLLGESQEDDRKNIAELVLTTMQVIYTYFRYKFLQISKYLKYSTAFVYV